MAGRVERRFRPAATPGYWRLHVHKETLHPLKRINRGASFIRDSTASSGVLPQPSAAKSQVQQILASPAMTRCRFSSDQPGYPWGVDQGVFRRPMPVRATRQTGSEAVGARDRLDVQLL